MSARCLAIDGSFSYLSGCTLIHFHGPSGINSEVAVVKESPNLDLGRFQEVHHVYKAVTHGLYTPQEGEQYLEVIAQRQGRHGTALRTFAYGMASIAIGSFNFSMRPADFVPAFLLGCVVGFLELVVAAQSSQFSHLFEVTAAILVASVSRGLGSIPYYGEPMFCFSAMAHSSLVVLLPGYTVLCAALELQSRNLAAGSARMVWAIIYSMFLGFGVLVGTVLTGYLLADPQSDLTCQIPPWWDPASLDARLVYVRFLWVPVFAGSIAIIYQAQWQQLPVMCLIATIGYEANFWISTVIANNTQIGSAVGALAIGVCGNLYSRLFHGLAAAAMLPAIIVQVPGGMAARLNLQVAVETANTITGDNWDSSQIARATAGPIWSVGYSGMLEVAIGSSVGFLLSAIIIYPHGKKRGGLFSY